MSNTDPALILKIIVGAKVFGLTRAGYRLILNHSNDVQEEVKQWSSILKIDPSLIGVTLAKVRRESAIPSSYGDKRCVMKVHFTGSCLALNKIHGIMNFLRESALGGSKQGN